MITLLSFRLPSLAQTRLESLPVNQFRVVELPSAKAFKQSDADIMITTPSQLKQFAPEDFERKALVLLTEESDALLSVYAQAKQFNSQAVLSLKELDQLEGVLQLAYQDIQTKRKHQFATGKSVGVLSTKGGVGKSVVSYHLAKHIQTYMPGKVALVDLGVPFGSLNSFCNINTTTSWETLRPLLKTGKELTPARLQSQMTGVHGFEVLGAPRQFSVSSLNPQELKHLISAMSKTYVLTLCDLSPAIGSQLEEYVHCFDLLIWVFTPDSSSFEHTLAFHTLMKTKYPQIQVIYLCNMVEPSQDKQIIHQVQNMVKQPLEVIENDSEAMAFHQRKFELFSDDTFLLTKQFKEFCAKVFVQLANLKSSTL